MVFFSAALEQDPALFEVGADQRVILATPTTLIALLRTVAYGWQQEGLAQNAKAISELGKELYQRLAQLGDHFAKVGKNLLGATKAYNQAVGSLESRVMVSARKFEDLQVSTSAEGLPPLQQVEQTPRELQVAELRQEREEGEAAA